MNFEDDLIYMAETDAGAVSVNEDFAATFGDEDDWLAEGDAAVPAQAPAPIPAQAPAPVPAQAPAPSLPQALPMDLVAPEVNGLADDDHDNNINNFLEAALDDNNDFTAFSDFTPIPILPQDFQAPPLPPPVHDADFIKLEIPAFCPFSLITLGRTRFFDDYRLYYSVTLNHYVLQGVYPKGRCDTVTKALLRFRVRHSTLPNQHPLIRNHFLPSEAQLSGSAFAANSKRFPLFTFGPEDLQTIHANLRHTKAIS